MEKVFLSYYSDLRTKIVWSDFERILASRMVVLSKHKNIRIRSNHCPDSLSGGFSRLEIVGVGIVRRVEDEIPKVLTRWLEGEGRAVELQHYTANLGVRKYLINYFANEETGPSKTLLLRAFRNIEIRRRRQILRLMDMTGLAKSEIMTEVRRKTLISIANTPPTQRVLKTVYALSKSGDGFAKKQSGSQESQELKNFEVRIAETQRIVTELVETLGKENDEFRDEIIELKQLLEALTGFMFRIAAPSHSSYRSSLLSLRNSVIRPLCFGDAQRNLKSIADLTIKLLEDLPGFVK